MDCSTCDKPSSGNVTICSACEIRLVGWLREIPWLLDELEVTITRQDQVSEKQPGKSNEKPLIFNERASEAKSRLLVCLRYHASVHGWCDGRADPWDYLLGHMHSIRLSEHAGNLFRSIQTVAGTAKRVIDRPAERVFAGPCNTPFVAFGGSGTCTADLYAREGKATVKCRECGAEHDVQTRREWMLGEVRNYDADAGLMASILTGLGFKIDSSTIRKYGNDGLIPEVRGKSPTGAARYNIGDVLDTFAVKKEAKLRKKAAKTT